MVWDEGIKAAKVAREAQKTAYNDRLSAAQLAPLSDDNYNSYYRFEPCTRNGWLLHRLLIRIEGIEDQTEFDRINAKLFELEQSELSNILLSQSIDGFTIASALGGGKQIVKSDLAKPSYHEELKLFVLSSLQMENSDEYHSIKRRLARQFLNSNETAASLYIRRPME